MSLSPPLLQIFWDPLRGRERGGDLQNNQYFSKARKTFPPPPFSHSRGKQEKNPMASKKERGSSSRKETIFPILFLSFLWHPVRAYVLAEYPPLTNHTPNFARRVLPSYTFFSLFWKPTVSLGGGAGIHSRHVFAPARTVNRVRAYLGMGKTIVVSIPLLLVPLFLLRSPMCYRRAWFYF